MPWQGAHSAGRDGMSLSIAKTIPDALWVTISTERGAGIESLENESPNARVLLLP